ncbi:response regulator [Paenibacillus sp.]|uniref:response regulator n=1 Tax=Paenibacillus sp. TaxID=58172 RepID=UPI002D66688A|nr:response regulator [Paenibacillus sp.]HZG86874.1 response regulator [Paenibacillus sp.]
MTRRVVIIDDEPWSREVVKSLGEWSKLGLTVSGEAEDGKQGIRLVEELRPHIVVTDMRMPGIDGVELLQQLKERFPSLKIVVMSGYDDFVYLKQAIQSRAVEYMLKPFDPNELNEALRRCVRELEAEEQTVRTSWTSPLALPDPALMERLLAIRQRIFAGLFELNKPALLQSFEKLEELLRKAYPDGADAAMLRMLHADFLGALREFMAGHPDPVPEDGGEPSARAWADAYGAAVDRVEAHRNNKTRLVVEEVAAFIDAHFAEPISLETVARRFYVSKEHLSRTFKQTTGVNVSDYIVRRRIEQAKALLADGVAIKHAARAVGYPELAYFHRIFKKETGLTPGEYRSAHHS